MIRATNDLARAHCALAVTLAVCGSLSAAALTPMPQGKSQEELARLRDEKKAEPVFEKSAWTFDYDVARERAREQEKLIFAYFTRSYAG